MSSRSAGGTVTGVCRTEWNITEETKGIIEEMEQKNGANGHSKFEVENLNLHYGNFHALKDINMKIEEHEITAFIGPSGCGKSTFLKTLNRMNDLVENVKIEGNIHLDGADIFQDLDAISLRHRVGMVFQQPNPFPKSVYDNVAYGPRIFGIRKNLSWMRS